MKIQVVWAGKTRNPDWRKLQDEYAGRIRRYTSLSIDEVREAGRPDQAGNQPAILAVEGERLASAIAAGAVVVVLDEQGQAWTTGVFQEWMEGLQNRGVKQVSFLVGGFLGMAPELKSRADVRLALSPLTLPHEMARVVLLEQIYRVLSMLRGHPYHKA
ncbi:MAG: 23S rRNA (pseudouridine(1915)-N(3))-methyltransferase RlmH [Acidobacteriota bacterium]